MTAWTDLLLDAAPVNAIFGTTPPVLAGIDLHEISLNRDGPRLLLRFDLRDFPANPPKKWATAGFNRIQLRLQAVGVQDVQIVGFRSSNRLSLEIYKDGDSIRLSGDNGLIRVGLLAKALIVERISAYRDSTASVKGTTLDL